MGVDAPSPWYFSLEFCASRIKTSCNCCGIQDCCTLILLTAQQGKGKEKTTMEKLCANTAANWLSQNANTGIVSLSQGMHKYQKEEMSVVPLFSFPKLKYKDLRGKKNLRVRNMS